MDVRVEALVAVVALAALHLSGRHLRLLDSGLGARFGRVGQGCLVAYAVLDLLPEVAAAEQELEAGWLGTTPFAEPAWLACLLGMLVLTVVELPNRRPGSDDAAVAGADAAFVLTLAAHVVANVNVGVLLLNHHQDGVAAVVALSGLLVVHLALVEREHLARHAPSYRRWGRPALAAALVVGGALGAFWEPTGSGLAVLQAALAGLLVLNTFQHHLSEAEVARSPDFLAGALLYGAALSLT